MKKVLIFIIMFFIFNISASALTAVVKVDDALSIRSNPGSEYAAINWLPNGTTINILDTNAGVGKGCNGPWYKVSYDIHTGYSCSDYIEIENIKTEENVICIEDDSPLNIWNNTSRSSKLGSLNCNEKVTVLEKNVASNNSCANWYKVQKGSVIGYSCGKYISPTPNKDSLSIGKSTSGDNIYLKENYSSKSNKDGFIACYEDTGDVSLRKTPGGDLTGVKLSCGKNVTINKVIENKGGACPYYYNVTDENGSSGYICGYFVNTTKLSETALNYYKNKESLEEYAKRLTSLGFPDSYLPYLEEVHARHPNWIFEAEKINIDFNDVIKGESAYGRNLLEGSSFNNNYYSMDLNTYNIFSNTFYEYPTEKGWYNASSEAIAYYMDPRNYLNEKYIFAFESLHYNSSHTSNITNKILSGQSFWNSLYSGSGRTVGDDIVKACFNVKNNTNSDGISAAHIASRIKQEISGLDLSDPRLGSSFTYNNQSYSGYYNFFNISVWGDDKVIRGMKYAMDNGWNSPYNAIYGGAYYIYDDYIKINQDTMYYEKFDVSTSDGNYDNQYMQNLAAPMQETDTSYRSYITIDGYLSNDNIFIIPVYNNMPAYAVTAPSTGNPNNYLKDLKINNETINNFSYDTYEYSVSIPYETNNIIVGATAIVSSSFISGNTTYKNDKDTNKIEVKVTSESGKVRIYTINITRLEKIKEDDNSNLITIDKLMNSSGVKYNDSYIYKIGANTSVSSFINNIQNTSSYATVSIKDNGNNNKSIFKTGDKVVIGNTKDKKEYEVLIYGDINGDGKIDKDDCLAILRQINGYANYTGVYKVAADPNKDGKIDKDDCLAILRDINGYTNLNS